MARGKCVLPKRAMLAEAEAEVLREGLVKMLLLCSPATSGHDSFCDVLPSHGYASSRSNTSRSLAIPAVGVEE